MCTIFYDPDQRKRPESMTSMLDNALMMTVLSFDNFRSSVHVIPERNPKVFRRKLGFSWNT